SSALGIGHTLVHVMIREREDPAQNQAWRAQRPAESLPFVARLLILMALLCPFPRVVDVIEGTRDDTLVSRSACHFHVHTRGYVLEQFEAILVSADPHYSHLT